MGRRQRGEVWKEGTQEVEEARLQIREKELNGKEKSWYEK